MDKENKKYSSKTQHITDGVDSDFASDFAVTWWLALLTNYLAAKAVVLSEMINDESYHYLLLIPIPKFSLLQPSTRVIYPPLSKTATTEPCLQTICTVGQITEWLNKHISVKLLCSSANFYSSHSTKAHFLRSKNHKLTHVSRLHPTNECTHDKRQHRREQSKTGYDPKLNRSIQVNSWSITLENGILTSLGGEDLIRHPSQLALGADRL